MINKSFEVPVIGIMHSPYASKFAVPRQASLAPKVLSTISFYPPYGDPQAFIGLEGFSHLHVIFIFDQALEDKFRPMVRPPRLGGNRRVGIFATRSPFRPSHLGLSTVKLERIEHIDHKVQLTVSGADLADGTPIVDIKPYIPFVDAIPDARCGYASAPPPVKEVVFAPGVYELLLKLIPDNMEALMQVLAQDPRPAYKALKDDEKIYHASLFGLDIMFKADERQVQVTGAALLTG